MLRKQATMSTPNMCPDKPPQLIHTQTQGAQDRPIVAPRTHLWVKWPLDAAALRSVPAGSPVSADIPHNRVGVAASREQCSGHCQWVNHRGLGCCYCCWVGLQNSQTTTLDRNQTSSWNNAAIGQLDVTTSGCTWRPNSRHQLSLGLLLLPLLGGCQHLLLLVLCYSRLALLCTAAVGLLRVLA